MFDDDSRWGDSRDRHDDPRDIESRDREPVDPRDVFMHDLDLPRFDERERVHDRVGAKRRALHSDERELRVDRRPVTQDASSRVPYRAWLSSGVQSGCCGG